MDAKGIRELMNRLAGGVGQQKIALRCDCENFETVFVLVDENGEVCVTDDHRTFQYLARGTDATYVPLPSLDMTAASQACAEFCVDLKPAPPDGYPSIECVVGREQSIQETVERVAEAVDRVFNLAMRSDLR